MSFNSERVRHAHDGGIRAEARFTATTQLNRRIESYLFGPDPIDPDPTLLKLVGGLAASKLIVFRTSMLGASSVEPAGKLFDFSRKAMRSVVSLALSVPG